MADTSTDPPDAPKPHEPPKCLVCAQVFDNEAGKAGHVAVTKDADHEAYRALGVVPKVAEGRGEGPAVKVAEGLAEVKVEGSPPTLGKVADPAPGQPSDPTFENKVRPFSQQEAEGLDEAHVVTFALPDLIEPLRPEPLQPSSQGAGGNPGGPSPAVAIDLAPVIAGGVALSLNGLVLNKAGDGKLTPEMVAQTQFPAAVEACVRLYFPKLPIDHPVVALVASGLTLGVVVQSLKAKPDAKDPPKPTAPAPTTRPAPAPTPPPAPPTPQPAPEPTVGHGTTGDPYWDTLLASAGGVAL